MTNEAGQSGSMSERLASFDMMMPDGQVKSIYTFGSTQQVSKMCPQEVQVDVAKRLLHLRLSQLGRLHHGLSVMIDAVDEKIAPFVIDQMTENPENMANFEFWNFQYQQQTPQHNASQSEGLFGEHVQWHLLPAQMTIRKRTLAVVEQRGEFTYFRGPIGPAQYRQYRVITTRVQKQFSQEDFKNEIRKRVELRIKKKPELWREWRNIIRSVTSFNQHVILSTIVLPDVALWEFEVDNFLSTENWALPVFIPQPTEALDLMPPAYETPPPSCSPSSVNEQCCPVNTMQFFHQQRQNYTPYQYKQEYQIPNAYGYAVQAQLAYPGYTVEHALMYHGHPTSQQQFPGCPPAYSTSQHQTAVPAASDSLKAMQQTRAAYGPSVQEVVQTGVQDNVQEVQKIENTLLKSEVYDQRPVLVLDSQAASPVEESHREEETETPGASDFTFAGTKSPIDEGIQEEEPASRCVVEQIADRSEEESLPLDLASEGLVEIDEKFDVSTDKPIDRSGEDDEATERNNPSARVSLASVSPAERIQISENLLKERVHELVTLIDELEKTKLDSNIGNATKTSCGKTDNREHFGKNSNDEEERLKEEKRDKKRAQRQKKAAAKKQERKNNKRIESELKQAQIAEEKKKKEAKQQALADAKQEVQAKVQLRLEDEERIRNFAPAIVKNLKDVNTDEKKALLAVPLPNLPEEIIDVIRKSLTKNIISNSEIEEAVNNAIIGSAQNPIEIIQRTIGKSLDQNGEPKFVSPSNIEVKLLERISNADAEFVPRYAKILDRIYRKSVANVQLLDKTGKTIQLGEKDPKPRNPNASKRAAERDVFGFSQVKPLFLLPFPAYPVPTYVATQRLLALAHHEKMPAELRHRIMKSLTNNSRRLQASYFLLFIYAIECLLPDVYMEHEQLLWLYLKDLLEMRFFSSRENTLVSNWTAAFASHVDFEKPGQAIPDHLVNGIAALLVQRPKNAISKAVAAKWKDAEEKLVKLVAKAEEAVNLN